MIPLTVEAIRQSFPSLQEFCSKTISDSNLICDQSTSLYFYACGVDYPAWKWGFSWKRPIPLIEVIFNNTSQRLTYSSIMAMNHLAINHQRLTVKYIHWLTDVILVVTASCDTDKWNTPKKLNISATSTCSGPWSGKRYWWESITAPTRMSE